jgi:hypothetical protein
MVDASHEKEAKAKETIQQLKMEIANLTRLVEQGSGLALGEESTLNDLLKQKEELVRERDMQVDQIMALRAELMDTQVSAFSHVQSCLPAHLGMPLSDGAEQPAGMGICSFGNSS